MSYDDTSLINLPDGQSTEDKSDVKLKWVKTKRCFRCTNCGRMYDEEPIRCEQCKSILQRAILQREEVVTTVVWPMYPVPDNPWPDNPLDDDDD